MTENVGHKGEAVAAKYYQQRGWLLLNHNYRTRMGEIDLILYKEGTLVLAEVKTRTGAEDRLHDNRARSEEEAILWHMYSKKSHAYHSALNFYNASKADRAAVIKFLQSI